MSAEQKIMQPVVRIVREGIFFQIGCSSDLRSIGKRRCATCDNGRNLSLVSCFDVRRTKNHAASCTHRARRHFLSDRVLFRSEINREEALRYMRQWKKPFASELL